jgi:hypothetical protein
LGIQTTQSLADPAATRGNALAYQETSRKL